MIHFLQGIYPIKSNNNNGTETDLIKHSIMNTLAKTRIFLIIK